MTKSGGRPALNPAVVRRRYLAAKVALEARRRDPTVEAIAEELGRSPRTVREWRQRFGLADLDGLPPAVDPVMVKIKDGWAALGDGWAVFDATQVGVRAKYAEAVRLHHEIAQRRP